LADKLEKQDITIQVIPETLEYQALSCPELNDLTEEVQMYVNEVAPSRGRIKRTVYNNNELADLRVREL